MFISKTNIHLYLQEKQNISLYIYIQMVNKFIVLNTVAAPHKP